MLQNYLKLAFRNLARQKVFSVINILGLAVGLASALLICLWVLDELDYDRFHKNSEATYRLTAGASGLEVAVTPAPVGPALKEAIPEIRESVRMWPLSSVMLQANDKKFEEKQGFYVEPSFFDVFDFNLIKGNPKTALSEPNGVILSQELAIKYFGTTDAIGKTLRKDNQDDFVVTGVLAKCDKNSHLRFDFLMPFAFIATRDRNIRDNVWSNFNFYTYVVFDQPKNKAFISGMEKQIDKLFASHEKELVVQFTLQPLTDIHLHSHLMADVAGHGNAKYVLVFEIIAVFIVLIGCINFMNLSTARSARRAKEVGLRKVAGALRTQLVKQFLGESILICVISLVAAVVIVLVALPTVNDMTGKHLALNLADPAILSSVLAITLITGIFAGIYPAVILSGFTPIKVLKKDIKSAAGGVAFRNVLVVTQFVISIVLLVGTAVVYQQLKFMREKDLGFNKENLLYLNLRGDAYKTLNNWRAAFEANPATANVSIASGLPTNHISGTSNVEWPGMDLDVQVIFAELYVDENFIPVYNMQLVTGRNFHHELRGDSTNFLINEKAAHIMGFTPESAIGQTVTRGGNKGVIVGVVKDFNFKPLQELMEPLIMEPNTWGGVVVIKAEAGKTRETIAAMEQIWNRLETVYPFAYNFVDEDLDKLYSNEKQIGSLFMVFAVLAILVSCLGLYGLSAYIAEQRTREIGIRKALGASVPSLVYLLNTRFVIPVILAMLIAGPLAYFVMNQWLEAFAYKINFNWWIVLFAGVMAVMISLLTVTYESLKAARVNPVKSLRTE